MKRELRIIYMGTPEFAVVPLHEIIKNGFQVLAVVTAPDKPAGRGQRIHFSPVKEFALASNIPVLQPVSLKAAEFVAQLKSYNANLFVVVAFRMLPEIVWQMPEYGTLNLHASLLPQYRGAAPINHAIIKGETETGLTTFFIEKEIDTGKIILSSRLNILPSDDAGSLHDRLMASGALLMAETLKSIEEGTVKATIQDIPDSETLKTAPKIFKNDCKINWNASGAEIHNFIRGLSPFPGAYTNLITEEGIKQIKIFRTTFTGSVIGKLPGTIVTDHKRDISVATLDGLIHIEELQMEGKKRMTSAELLRGIKLKAPFRFE